MTQYIRNWTSDAPGERPDTGELPKGAVGFNRPDRQLFVGGPEPVDYLPIRQFSPEALYVAGDLIATGGAIYRATRSLPAGEFNPDDWAVVTNLDAFPGLGLRAHSTAQALRDAGPGAPCEGRVTLGALSVGDGGGGAWRWDASSTADDNLGTVLLPTGHVGPGRYLRVVNNGLNPLMFGAARDAIWDGSDWIGTDDTDAIQALENAAYELGVPVQWRSGFYLVVGTICKRRGVNWYAPVGHWEESPDAIGANLCASHSTTSTKDPATNTFSNAVINIDYNTHDNYFCECEIQIGIIGCPSNALYYESQCPRVAINFNLQSEIRITQSRIAGMRGALVGASWQDSSFEGHIIGCGYDHPTDPIYAIHMDTNPTQNSVIDGCNAITFGPKATRFDNCFLVWYFNNEESSGGIRFLGCKFEDNRGFSDEARNTNPPVITRSRPACQINAISGDVFFGGGTTFRTLRDTASRYFFDIKNDRTVFDGVGFFGPGRWISHTGKALVVTNWSSQACLGDEVSYVIGDGAIVTNGGIEQNMDGLTERKAFFINGRRVNIDNVVFRNRPQDTIGAITSGALFSCGDDCEDISLRFTVEEGKYWRQVEYANDPEALTGFENGWSVCRTGNIAKTWTDADWAIGGQIYVAANTAKIRLRRWNYQRHVFNPQLAPLSIQQLGQGMFGEIVTLEIDSGAAYPVTVLSNSVMVPAGGANCVLGVDAARVTFLCHGGSLWVEIARSIA